MRKINFNPKYTWTWPPSNKEKRKLAEKQKLAVAVEKLPGDVIVETFKFLNVRELINHNGVSTVCERWRAQVFKNLEYTMGMRTVEILDIREGKKKLCVMKFILWNVEPEKVLRTKAFMEDPAFLKAWEDFSNSKDTHKIDKGNRISHIVSAKLFAKGFLRFLPEEIEGKRMQHAKLNPHDLPEVLKLVSCVRLHLKVGKYSEVISSMTQNWEPKDFFDAALLLALKPIFCPEIN